LDPAVLKAERSAGRDGCDAGSCRPRHGDPDRSRCGPTCSPDPAHRRWDGRLCAQPRRRGHPVGARVIAIADRVRRPDPQPPQQPPTPSRACPSWRPSPAAGSIGAQPRFVAEYRRRPPTSSRAGRPAAYQPLQDEGRSPLRSRRRR
jgi:hypothetical protein